MTSRRSRSRITVIRRGKLPSGIRSLPSTVSMFSSSCLSDPCGLTVQWRYGLVIADIPRTHDGGRGGLDALGVPLPPAFVADSETAFDAPLLLLTAFAAD